MSQSSISDSSMGAWTWASAGPRWPPPGSPRTCSAWTVPLTRRPADKDDGRCSMSMRDDYLWLMKGLIGGMVIALVLVCAVIAAIAVVVS